MGWNRSQLVSLALRWQFWKPEALFLTAAFQCSGSFFESLCLELMVFWPRHRPIPGLGVSKEEVSQVKRQCFFVFLSSCHFPGVHLLLLELENLKSDTFWKHMQGCRDRKREWEWLLTLHATECQLHWAFSFCLQDKVEFERKRLCRKLFLPSGTSFAKCLQGLGGRPGSHEVFMQEGYHKKWWNMFEQQHVWDSIGLTWNLEVAFCLLS